MSFNDGGFVQCSVHHARRRMDCCEKKAVLNADMEVLDYEYVCRADNQCKVASGGSAGPNGLRGRSGTSAGGAGTDATTPVIFNGSSSSMLASQERLGRGAGAARDASLASTVFSVSFHTETATAAAPPLAEAKSDGENRHAETTEVEQQQQEEEKAVGGNAVVSSPPSQPPSSPAVGGHPRGGNRYYDLLQKTGGGANGGAGVTKVCWSCGLPGHEKPSCPNVLCRSCHMQRPLYGVPHRCADIIVPSPFIVAPSPQSIEAAKSEKNGMAAVRCIRCFGLGHFDCGDAASSSRVTLQQSELSCSFCGARGHSVHDCRQRDNYNVDPFEKRNLFAAQRGMGNGATLLNTPVSSSSYRDTRGQGYDGHRQGYEDHHRHHSSHRQDYLNQQHHRYSRDAYPDRHRSGGSVDDTHSHRHRRHRDDDGGGGAPAMRRRFEGYDGSSSGGGGRRYDAPSYDRGSSDGRSASSIRREYPQRHHGGGRAERHGSTGRGSPCGGGGGDGYRQRFSRRNGGGGRQYDGEDDLF